MNQRISFDEVTTNKQQTSEKLTSSPSSSTQQMTKITSSNSVKSSFKKNKENVERTSNVKFICMLLP